MSALLRVCVICGNIIWPWQHHGWMVARSKTGREIDYFHRACFRIRRN